MGKAAKQLNKARKAWYEEKKVPVQSIPIDTESQDRMARDYDDETSLILRDRLAMFAKKSGYPLCENLDFYNTDIYVTWLLKYARF